MHPQDPMATPDKFMQETFCDFIEYVAGELEKSPQQVHTMLFEKLEEYGLKNGIYPFTEEDGTSCSICDPKPGSKKSKKHSHKKS